MVSVGVLVIAIIASLMLGNLIGVMVIALCIANGGTENETIGDCSTEGKS